MARAQEQEELMRRERNHHILIEQEAVSQACGWL